jgi:hypothetical protein
MEHRGVYEKLWVRGHELEAGDLIIEDDRRNDLLSAYLADVQHEDDENGDLVAVFRDSDLAEAIDNDATYVIFRELPKTYDGRDAADLLDQHLEAFPPEDYDQEAST